MKIDVQITGTEAVRAELLRIGSLPNRALAATVEQVEDYVHAEVGKHSKTGAMWRAVDKRRIPDGWEVFHDLQHAPQALWVHWGTKPHVIVPRAGGSYKSYKTIEGKTARKGIKKGGQARTMLRWASGGIFHFARKVNHPGYKGDPWLVRAAAMAPRIFEQQLAAMMAATSKG